MSNYQYRVPVQCVRAMGAHGEGPRACIGGLEGDGCSRSTIWGHVEVSHMLGGTQWARHDGGAHGM